MNIKKEKERLLEFIKKNAEENGTDLNCSIRDLLTDLIDICEDNKIDFDERVLTAQEVLQIERFMKETEGEDFDED